MNPRKVKKFIVDYTRDNEMDEDYHRELPPELFQVIYAGFEMFGKRAEPGDTVTMTLGCETWAIRAI